MDDIELRLRLMLRQFDRLWMVTLVVAAVLFALANFFAPGQGFVSFGAIMMCIWGVCWWINRRLEIARFKSGTDQNRKPPKELN